MSEDASEQQGPTELVAITRVYDLARELTSRVVKYPRSHRFVLGDRSLGTAYDVLDLLVTARYRRDKAALLDEANVAVQRLRFQWRLAHDERIVSTKGFEHVTKMIDEVGRLVGGWRKSRSQ